MFGFGKKSKKAQASEQKKEAGNTGDKQDQADTDQLDADLEADDQNIADDLPLGPWDVHDEDAPDFDGMIDIGSMYLPLMENAELRLKAKRNQEGEQTIVGATITVNDSSLELEAFAAPKTMSLWDDIRQELIQSNSQAKEEEGDFGTEVLLPVKVKDKTFMSRIVGVDGPRWMLRGIFTGPAAQEDTDPRKDFDDFFAQIVVNRGNEPLAPRDLIPMTMPEEIHEDDDDDDDLADKAKRPVKPNGYDVQTTVQTTLTRGPLFSEMR